MNNWINELKTIPVWSKFSQCNEECYLDHILKNVEHKKTIVELGAGDGYALSNTRYFINDCDYESLLIDGDGRGNMEIKEHFIKRENIIEILNFYGTPKIFGLLCIDLDGNDIYVLEEMLSVFSPTVIVAEFNGKFSPHESVAIQYDENHTWQDDDYYGFSFAAGVKMGKKFGYTCIFQNDNMNMYFVKNEALAKSLNIEEGELETSVPPATYTPSVYHPQGVKQSWVNY